MADKNSDHSDEFELEGMESAMAVNDEMPIPAGEQQRAVEHMRAIVEREREIQERKRELQPDTELLEQHAAYREQVAERLASELNLTEEFENLRDRQQSTAQESNDGGTRGADAGEEGDNE
ncbi:hypothetical protein RBH20_19420 [Haloarcula sp. H-GB4]|uniref:hypothetical protein n=1 Tax=Haloarcula sp. H-GB4 TaxID=3069755 RepID=UPI0027AFD7C9|nr:hypothetical protein [Haloarcula sp. H-GB4]MDQ2074702.1 hypothetical protein [Haloarcula sp. H-GB4]